MRGDYMGRDCMLAMVDAAVPTALVTGSSSGIGRATSLALARAGHAVYATMRDTSCAGAGDLERAASEEGLDIRVARLDVVDDPSVEAAALRVGEEAGRLDVLVNNAGYGAVGAVEDLPLSEFRAQFETNLFGTIRVTKAALPLMRRTAAEAKKAAPGPTIVNVSSVAGRIGFPATSAYISSKFALEGFSESLGYELAPFGVRVVIVEPGVIKTSFFDSMRIREPPKGSVYADMAAKVVSNVRMMVELGTEAGDVAETIAKAVASDRPLPRYVVGSDAAMFLEARRSKTDAEFVEYMSKELFGGS